MTAPAPRDAFRAAAAAAAPGPTGAPAAAELASVLARRWAGVALCALACVAAAAAVLASLPPRYVAQAEVLLEARAPRVVSFDEVLPAPAMDAQAVQSEIRLARSRRLLGRVADKLRLDADPEFGAPSPESVLDGLGGRLRGVAETWLGWAPGAPVPPPGAGDAQRRAAATLGERLSVVQQDVSRVIALRVESRDPRKAALIANAVADQYIVDQLQAKFEATERAARWLSERLDETAGRLEAAETAAAAQRARLAAGHAGGPEGVRRRLADLAGALSALEAGPETPRAAGRAAALRRSIARLEAEAAARSRGEIRLRQLEREAEALAALHDAVLGRLKETRAQAGLERPDARLIAPAEAPLRPAAPNARLVLGFALLGGLALGGAGAFWRESVDGAHHSAEHLARDTGLPVLAALPRTRAGRRRDPVAEARRRAGAPIAEGARDLRAAMLSGAEGPLTLAVVSAGPGEGRSTAAALLAESCAHLGRRSVLVDADIRNPGQAARYGLAGRPDLIAALEGEATLSEAVWQAPERALSVLPADAAPAARADLLAGPAFAELLALLRERFDVVVLDTPPLLAVADGRHLAAAADRVVALARWGRTRRADLRAALRLLEDAGAPARGLAMSAAPRRSTPWTGHDGPGGRYARFSEHFEG